MGFLGIFFTFPDLQVKLGIIRGTSVLAQLSCLIPIDRDITWKVFRVGLKWDYKCGFCDSLEIPLSSQSCHLHIQNKPVCFVFLSFSLEKATNVSKQPSLGCPKVLGHAEALLSLETPAALPSAGFCSRTDPGNKWDLQYSTGSTGTAGWQVYELKLEQNQRLAWFLSLSCITVFCLSPGVAQKQGISWAGICALGCPLGAARAMTIQIWVKHLGFSVTRHTSVPDTGDRREEPVLRAVSLPFRLELPVGCSPKSRQSPFACDMCTGPCLDHLPETKVLAS